MVERGDRRRYTIERKREFVWVFLFASTISRSLILFLSSLDDLNELQVVELASLNGGFLPGLFQLIFAELISDVHEKVLDVFLVELAGASAVKHGEGIPEGGLRIGSMELFTK